MKLFSVLLILLSFISISCGNKKDSSVDSKFWDLSIPPASVLTKSQGENAGQVFVDLKGFLESVNVGNSELDLLIQRLPGTNKAPDYSSISENCHFRQVTSDGARVRSGTYTIRKWSEDKVASKACPISFSQGAEISNGDINGRIYKESAGFEINVNGRSTLVSTISWIKVSSYRESYVQNGGVSNKTPTIERHQKNISGHYKLTNDPSKVYSFNIVFRKGSENRYIDDKETRVVGQEKLAVIFNLPVGRVVLENTTLHKPDGKTEIKKKLNDKLY